ncbi:MAG: PASTA domain-containing protein [Nitrospiraceae bacterium]|nr:MAG: PASTA domain-containing protein [Nitrospiraceae bacterium]
MKNILRLFLYLIVFTGVWSVAAYLVFQLIDLNKTVKVPLLVGKSIDDATRLLETQGLSLEVEGEGYDPEIPPDYIISQNMKEGENILKGASIRVVISSEDSKYAIPFLEGMDISDVRLTLTSAGMEIGRISLVHSDSIEKNRVIAQRPLPGNSDEKTVNLVVSLGPYVVSYTCPSFVNMTIKEARRLARTLGLKLTEKDEGRVIVLQKPEAGSIVQKGETIEVTLGRGRGFWF